MPLTNVSSCRYAHPRNDRRYPHIIVIHLIAHLLTTSFDAFADTVENEYSQYPHPALLGSVKGRIQRGPGCCELSEVITSLGKIFGSLLKSFDKIKIPLR